MNDYNPAIGLIQTAAQVAGRLQQNTGDNEAWAASFETVYSTLSQEVGADAPAKSAQPAPQAFRASTSAPAPSAAPVAATGKPKRPDKQAVANFMWQNPHLTFDNVDDSNSSSNGGNWADFKLGDKAPAPYGKCGLWKDSIPSSVANADGSVEDFGSGQNVLLALRAKIAQARVAA
jgi:hypothetical protein